MADYTRTREDRFSFGLWTVGWQGVDVFGGVVRPPMAPADAVHRLSELGEAEAWFIIEAPKSGVVHVEWTRDIAPPELTGWVDSQDVAAMIDAMHVLNVAGGDSVYVPPGTVHTIGAGIFLVEVQHAADLSMPLEWKGFFPASSGAFLGVAPAAALGCVDLGGLPAASLEALVERSALDRPVGSRLLPTESTRYFSATLLGAASTWPSEYRTLVVIAGDGRLRALDPSQSHEHDTPKGATFAVPAGAGPLLLEGSNELKVLAFGPRGADHVHAD